MIAAFLTVLLASGAVSQTVGDVIVSANDGNQILVNGAQAVPDRPLPGSLSIIALDPAPHIVANVPVAASVIGPPRSVAVSADGAFAIVTSARKVDPSNPHAIVPDDQVALVDLKGRPHVAAVAHSGAGASGIAIDPTGTRALIANRAEGSVSLFAIGKSELRRLETVKIGEPDSSPAQPLYFDDGKRALVTRDGDNRVAVLDIESDRLKLLPQSLAAGLRPYAIDSAGPRHYAVVGDIGGGGRDVDTIALIDLTGREPRVVDIVSVGLTPEGLKMSPDGRFVAVNVNNGSNEAKESSLYSDHGLLQVWRIEAGRLQFVTQAPLGRWGQGVAWSRDGKTLLAQAMVGQRIDCFRFDGRTLTACGAIAMPAGPAAISAAGD